jgi:hypothetical protein
MARQEYLCAVLQARVSVGVPGTTDPTIQLILTDSNGTFANEPFFAADAGKNQMLDVALAAISTQSQVSAYVDNPTQPVSPPGAQIYALSIMAS